MPDYANMPIYRHGLRAYEPTTREEVFAPLDPTKRYNLQFTSEEIPAAEATPEMYEEAIREREAVGEMGEFPAWGYGDVSDLADYDYRTGQLATQNQYLEDMKIVDQLPQGSQQGMVLSQWAASKFQSQMAEMESNKQRWENARKRLRQDVNIGREARIELENNFYSKNPIYETKELRLGARKKEIPRGKPLAVSSIDNMAERAKDMAVAQESWWPGVGTSKENIEKAIKRAADMAGWKDLNTSTKEALLASLDVKMKNTGETKKEWDEDLFEEIGDYIGMEAPVRALAPGIAPTKPKWLIGYPDAVWNQQYKSWTVIKNGKLVALSEE